MIGNSVFPALALLIGIAQPGLCQPGWSNPLAPQPAQPPKSPTFKVGDYVDAQFAGQWLPCRINELLIYSGAVGGYMVACGPEVRGPERLQDVRPRGTTAEEKRVEAETAAALARQPHGNSIGGQYGTREPATCANRTAPAQGAPSPAQARQYFICDHEGNGVTFLSLVTNVNVQVAPRSHPPDPRASYATAPDLNQPAWDIRGSFVQYSCYKPANLIGPTDFARAHNCTTAEQPAATGYCYKNNFGDWHCPMWANPNAEVRKFQLPPAGN